MNILIVDGNEKKASEQYIQNNMPTQYEVYKDVLEKLLYEESNIVTLHPACHEKYIPLGVNLDDFDGIVWTGSLLNIYDKKPSIERQIELAKELLDKKNKIFGSCWGLQVLTTAAGGKVRRNPKGLEAVIAKNITLNKDGIDHPMYKNKTNVFDSFCWHYDEVEDLPANSTVLAYNDMSSIQSLSFFKGNSSVWAVQYHPEFNPQWISGLMKQRKSLLLDEGVYNSKDEFNELYLYLSNPNKYHYLKDKFSISETLILNNIHTLELSNWLKSLVENR